MSETLEEFGAKMRAAELERLHRKWPIKVKPVTYWPLYGLRHRLLMRTAHYFGFCYMKPRLGLREADGSVPLRIHHWCQWCGMRGEK